MFQAKNSVKEYSSFFSIVILTTLPDGDAHIPTNANLQGKRIRKKKANFLQAMKIQQVSSE